MIWRLEGVVQPYAWGSRTFLPALLGTEPTDEPQAELWLGAHPSAPSTVDGRPLPDLIDADPAGVLGSASVEAFGPQLSYLLKVLAADQPLSLQAHPSRAQAEEGFAREEKAGVPRDAKERLFKDDWPKPEMLCALVDSEALCGFRAPDRTYRLLEQLNAERTLDLLAVLGDASLPDEERLERAFTTVMRLDDPTPYVTEVLLQSQAFASEGESEGELGRLADTVRELGGYYPGDPGVLAALLMNRVSLRPGDAIFLDAGNLHAYLHGAGVEIMANSDNVLRGGLTSKHVDVDELVAVLDFRPIGAGTLTPDPVSPGVVRYSTPAPEFALWRLGLAGSPVDVPATEAGRVVVVVDGSATLTSDGTDLHLERGQSAFLATGTVVVARGVGTAFLAGPGV